jgi:hypothetical protein
LLDETTPSLDALTAADLIAVRDDDSFHAWRSDLTSALADLRARVDSGSGDLGRRELAETMRDRASAIDRATSRSQALASLRRAPKTFTLTLLGATALTPLMPAGSVTQEVAFASSATAVDLMDQLRVLVRDWLKAPASAPALAKHYAVFPSER